MTLYCELIPLLVYDFKLWNKFYGCVGYYIVKYFLCLSITVFWNIFLFLCMTVRFEIFTRVVYDCILFNNFFGLYDCILWNIYCGYAWVCHVKYFLLLCLCIMKYFLWMCVTLYLKYVCILWNNFYVCIWHYFVYYILRLCMIAYCEIFLCLCIS